MKPKFEEIAITPEILDGGHIKPEALEADELRGQIQDMLDEPEGGR